MAERTRYYTNSNTDEDDRIPELQELAAEQPAAETPAASVPAAQTPQLTPPSYDYSNRDKQSALYEQIANRGPFQYDTSKDPLYGMARDRYVQQGRMAMKDTMGQAAALTGGYGSSYGQAVGQQAYDRQLQGLADMIPELYNAAYKRYQDESDRLQAQYDLLGRQEEQAYSRYRDELGDWQYERAYQDQQAQQDYNKTVERAETMARLTGDFSGYEALGYSPEQIQALQKAWTVENPALAYQTGMITADEYKAMTGQWPVGYSAPSSGGGGYYYTAKKTEEEPEEEPGGKPELTEDEAVALLRANGVSEKEIEKEFKSTPKSKGATAGSGGPGYRRVTLNP